MINSDQDVYKTGGDELSVSKAKQRDIPVIATLPPESETKIFDTPDREGREFPDKIEMPIQKFKRKGHPLFGDKYDNTPFEVILKRTGKVMNPQKTIHQADIREDDLIQLHVRPRSEEKVIFSKQILLKEYRSMIDLKEESNGLIDFRVSNDYRKYTISVKGIKTIVDTTRENIVESDHYVFTIDLPSKYPLQPPVIRFNRTIFHPNWSSDGKVNYEMLWGSEDKKLSRILIYIINLMFFNIVNTHSPSNQEAIEYYKRNKGNIKNMSKVHLFLFSKGDGLEFYE